VRADHHAGGAFSVARQRPWEAAADTLGGGENVGRDAILFVAYSVRARDTALHLVPERAADRGRRKIAQTCRNSRLAGRTPALAWIGSTRKPAVLSSTAAVAAPDRRTAHRKAFQKRCETVAQLGLIGRADRAIVRPWKAFEKVISLFLVRIASGMVVATRSLDRALDRLRARISEENGVGEGQSTSRCAGARPAGCRKVGTCISVAAWR
jgi:hypothetical protein